MRFLLTEDDQELLQLLKKLENAGFAVDTACDVEVEFLGFEAIYDCAKKHGVSN